MALRDHARRVVAGDLVLRPADAADIALMVELKREGSLGYRRFYTYDQYQEFLHTLASPEWYEQQLADPDCVALIVEDEDGQVLSHALVRKLNDTTALLFSQFGPGQGRGAGKALLRERCRIAQAAGLQEVEVHVRARNERTLDWYLRLGFHCEGSSLTAAGDLTLLHLRCPIAQVAL